MTNRFEQLHLRYRQSLRGKHAALATLWDRAQDSVDSFLALQLAVHRLAGSAPIYGFDAIGDRARIADSLIDRVADGSGMPTDALQRQQVAEVVLGVLDALDVAAAAAEQVFAAPPLLAGHVLVIDDQPMRSAPLVRALEAAGSHVRVAVDATEVWQQLVAWPCTAAILDLRLRASDPVELVGMIRSEPRFANIHLIAAGHVEGTPGAECAACCDAVFGPCTPDQMLVSAAAGRPAQTAEIG